MILEPLSRELVLALLLSLGLVTCAPAHRPVSPAARNSARDVRLDETCIPRKPLRAPWRTSSLSKGTLSALRALLDADEASLERLLAPVSDSYYNRRYSDAEFAEAMAALTKMIREIPARFAALQPADDEPRLETQRRGEPAAFYFNPTCESCKHTLDVIYDAMQHCPHLMPPVVFRLLPSGEEKSLEAAATLQFVKTTRPTDFIPEARAFLSMLPENEAIIDDLASEAFQARDFRTHSTYVQALQAVSAARSEFPGNELAAPIVIYRGRLLRRDITMAVPFDPLYDSSVLLTTIMLIDASERAATDRHDK